MKIRSRITAAAMLACAGMLSACGSGGRAARSGVEDAISKTEADGEANKAVRADLPAADAETEDLRKYIDQFDPIVGMDGGGAGTNGRVDASGLEAAVAEIAGPGAGPGPARRVMDEPARVLDAPLPGVIPPPDWHADPLATMNEPTGVPAEDVPEGPEAPEARLARQLVELHQTIGDLRGVGGSGAGDAVQLLALQLLQDDAAAPELEALKQQLPPGQRRTLTTLQQLLREVRGEGEEAGLTALDARRVSRLLSEHGAELADARPLRISSAVLCTSVESFGVYSKFADYTFLQGRVQPVIVYVGLENFTQRPVGAPSSPEASLAGAAFNMPSEEERKKKEAWEKRAAEKKTVTPAKGANGWAVGTPDVVVRLTQSIAIHNDADDLVVWKAPEASIRDVSRERRQDYYLVQRMDLPARLTLGKYNIKITVRDVSTGATDETVIPIEVVADPALARGT